MWEGKFIQDNRAFLHRFLSNSLIAGLTGGMLAGANTVRLPTRQVLLRGRTLSTL